MKNRIPLTDAQFIAAEIIALLTPACERIAVAGSVRREKPTVGDIEIVAMPQMHYALDLFGDSAPEHNVDLLDKLCDVLLMEGTLAHRLDKNGRRAWGYRYKRGIFTSQTGQRVPLDLFSVLPPAQWGVIYTIRTGPSEFSHALVMDRRYGGAMPSGWMVRGGQLLAAGPDKVVETPEEQDFFAALGLPWIPPSERSLERLKAALLEGNDV